MILSSMLGGNSVAVGDIVQSYRNVLADGKRLLPCNGSPIPVDAPVLAALLSATPKEESQWHSPRANAGHATGTATVTGNGNRLLFAGHAGAYDELVAYDTTFVLGASVVVLHTPAVAFMGAYDMCATPSGSHIYVLRRSNTPQLYVSKSADAGATFTETMISSSPATSEPAGVEGTSIGLIRCSSDGQTVVVMFTGQSNTNGPVKYYKSTNAGSSWLEIHPDATTLNVANNARIFMGDDLDTFWYYNVLHEKYKQVGAVRTPFATPSPLLTANTVVSVSGNRVAVVGIGPATATTLPDSSDLVITYSDDVGVTWAVVRVSLELYRIESYRMEVASPTLSQLDSNYMYVVINSDYSDGADTTRPVSSRLVVINLTTGEVTKLITLPNFLKAGTVSANASQLRVVNSVVAGEEHLVIRNHSTFLFSKVTISYAKRTPVVVPSVIGFSGIPYKLVADKP